MLAHVELQWGKVIHEIHQGTETAVKTEGRSPFIKALGPTRRSKQHRLAEPRFYLGRLY